MDEVAEKYDITAEHYDKRYKDIQFEKYKLALSFLDNIEGSILDVGCGTGLLAEFLDMEIDGIDISRGMLEMSKGRLRYVQGDARKLPYADSSFDIVFSFTVLQNIKDYEVALKEIRRVMKSGARCVLTYLNKKEYSKIGDSIDSIFKVDDSFSFSEDVFYICSLFDVQEIT